MAWTEDEAIGPDVASTGLHVSERIGRDAAAQPDLEEGPRGLTPRGHASHPYSSYPNESFIKCSGRGGSVAVKVNDHIGNFFQTKKGLRQGDPLSPILFNLVADMLSILIQRAKDQGRFQGVIPHLVDNGLSILQYADDTILFMEHDLDEVKNLKLVLSTFEKLAGLKINFHKSELFCYGKSKFAENEYVMLFGCRSGTYPFRYLGIPMHHKKLSNKDWQIIEERFQRKLSSWKGKCLSVGGRLVLINSVLSSLAMFMLSFFEVPKGILKKLDYYRSRFFWQSDGHKRKYRLARWSVICTPKDCGGLGIQNLNVQNKCLLSKWLYKLINEDGVWQKLLRKKYLAKKTITLVEKQPGDSHFWAGLMEVKNSFLSCGAFQVALCWAVWLCRNDVVFNGSKTNSFVQVQGLPVVASKASKLTDLDAPISTSQTKYLELLARYQYLSSAAVQGKSEGITADSSRNPIDSSAVDRLEGKLAVLQFQMQIKCPMDKAKELSLNLKSITQLFNNYAVPFNLWEMLTVKLFEKFGPGSLASTRGGVAEACSVVRRVGSKLDPADGSCLPLDIICLHLEKAALDRLSSEKD
uniref:Retrotransposon protein, putative, unclassified n=1 Tax=Oryza sativa subsp. japonica TaxID=39947 RepID=Q10PS2_ORYSJ|nr:retrotransposon protein, putative, unclassified [Oryza sativa Japonica Group]